MFEIGQTAYHHGNLRRALVDAALAAIGEAGPTGWSLRDLARRAGVSHAAPVHHFGDKKGLVTAVATEGYELFADSLEAAGEDFLEAGVAYVRFAVTHRAHFAVMFRPELHHADDPALTAARDRAAAARDRAAAAIRGSGHDRALTIAAWSTAHGFAELWLSGALPEERDGDAETTARAVLQAAFGHLR